MTTNEIQLSPAAFFGAPVRADDLRFLIRCIRRGECCSVVAVSNMGKSYLLRSLCSEEVRRLCADQYFPLVLPVFVDCLMTSEISMRGFYELMLERFVADLEQSEIADQRLDTIQELRIRAAETSNVGLVLDLFRRTVRTLCRQEGVRIVLILDEFEELYKELPHTAILPLRALKDRWDDALVFITGTFNRLEDLRPVTEVHEFYELFRANVRILHLLDDADLDVMIECLLAEERLEPTENRVTALKRWSGGHPGLLAGLCRVLGRRFREDNVDYDVVFAQALSELDIELECRALWDNLEPYERSAMERIVAGEPLARWEQEGVRRLWVQRLVTSLSNPAPFGRLFELYVYDGYYQRAELPRHLQPGVYVDEVSRRVWADGRDVTDDVNRSMYGVLVLLQRNKGNVCSHHQIAKAGWGEMSGFTDGQVYQLIHRIRRVVEPDPRKPRYIHTVRGLGYRLENPK